MEWRNPQYNQFGTIDCEINHPEYGWIPFTASPDDPEEHGRALHAEIMGHGQIAPYVPPSPESIREAWRESAVLSPAEFFIAAKRLGILTPEEALEAAKGNAPELFIQIVSQAPDVDAVEAQILFARMTVVGRNHPFVLGAIQVLDKDPHDVDLAFGWQE